MGISKGFMKVMELELSFERQVRRRGCSRRSSLSQGLEEEQQRVYFSMESSPSREVAGKVGGDWGQDAMIAKSSIFHLILSRRMKSSELSLRLIS